MNFFSFIFLVLLTLPTNTFGLGAGLDLSKVNNSQIVGSELTYIYGDLIPNLALQKYQAGEFLASPKNHSHGKRKDLMWIAIPFMSSADASTGYKMYMMHAAAKTKEFWWYQDGEFNKIGDVGIARPRLEKTINVVLLPQPIPDVKNTSPGVMLVKFDGLLPISTSIYIMNNAVATEQMMGNNMLYGLYFGMTFLLAMISLALYRSIKDIAYVYYAFFTFGMFLLISVSSGYADSLLSLWFEPFLYKYVDSIRIIPSLFSIAFVRNFLDLAERTPLLDRLVGKVYQAALLIFAISLVSSSPAMAPFYDLLEAVTVVVLVSTSIHIFRFHRSLQNLVAMIAWTGFAATLIPWILSNVGVMQLTPTIKNACLAGSIWEIVVMSAALHIRTGTIKHAKDRLQEVALEKSHIAELIMALSHDLVNPIQVIDMSAALALDGDLSVKDRKYFNRIQRNSTLLGETINKVNQMSRLKDGLIDLQHIPVDLNHLAATVEDTFKARLEAKELTFVYSNPHSLSVLADETVLLVSIVSNLISNAIKFSETGGIIALRIHSPNPSQVCLSVADTGMGMPENILAHAFSQTVKTTRKGTGGEKGTGYGLPLVKKFVEASKGSIHIESKEIDHPSGVRGTTVTVTLENGTTAALEAAL